jgi:hypothetical protein
MSRYQRENLEKTLIDGETFFLKGATWGWLPGYSEENPRLPSSRVAIFAIAKTDYYGKPEIAYWQPDQCTPSTFTIIQERIKDTPKNWDALISGSNNPDDFDW